MSIDQGTFDVGRLTDAAKKEWESVEERMVDAGFEKDLKSWPPANFQKKLDAFAKKFPDPYGDGTSFKGAAKPAADKNLKSDEEAAAEKKKQEEEAAKKQQEKGSSGDKPSDDKDPKKDETPPTSRTDKEIKVAKAIGLFCDKVKEFVKTKGVKTYLAKRAPEVEWDLLDFSSPKFEDVMAAAVYCCVNGPVGIHGDTTFAGITGRRSIKTMFEEAGYKHEVSNNTWKRFCKTVSGQIDLNDPDLKSCTCIKQYGKLWPDCDPEFVTKDEAKREMQSKTLKTRGSKFFEN